MTTFTKQKLTFDQFLDQYPEDGRYELVDGKIVEMRAIRWHDDIADFMIRKFDQEVERLNLNYRVTGRLVLETQSSSGQQQGRQPDISVVDRNIWHSNRFAYAALDQPIQLAVEVVSTRSVEFRHKTLHFRVQESYKRLRQQIVAPMHHRAATGQF